MKQAVEEIMPQFVESFSRHTLTPVIEAGPVKVWRMKRPGAGSMYMVEIIVTSLGIIIHGDSHPTEQPVHARNGLDWFVSQLDTSYLASKFLRKQYTPQAARRHIDGCIETLKGELVEACAGEEGLDTSDLAEIYAWLQTGKGDINARARAAHIKGIIDELEEALTGEGLENEFSYHETFATILEQEDGDTEWIYPNHEYRPEDEALLAAIQQRFRSLFWERYEAIDEGGVLKLRGGPTVNPALPFCEALRSTLGDALRIDPHAAGLVACLAQAAAEEIPTIIATGVQALVANNAHLTSMIASLPLSGPMVVRATALPMFPVDVALPAFGVNVLMRRGDWFVVANRQPGNSQHSPLGRWSWPAGESAEISERVEKGDLWCHLKADLPPCATEPAPGAAGHMVHTPAADAELAKKENGREHPVAAAAGLISSVRIEPAGTHELLHVWNRGGLAGTLTLKRGDAVLVGRALAPRSLADFDAMAEGARIAEIEAERDALRARLRIAMQTEERPKGCQCDREFGDSSCPLHPTCPDCGESTVGRTTTCHACGYQLDGEESGRGGST